MLRRTCSKYSEKAGNHPQGTGRKDWFVHRVYLQIERNLTDPVLSTLRKLSAALDIPTYLLGGESSTSLTTRQADMMILSQPNSNAWYHLLTPMPNGNFVPQSLVIHLKGTHCRTATCR